jgi:hypothetical protein
VFRAPLIAFVILRLLLSRALGDAWYGPLVEGIDRVRDEALARRMRALPGRRDASKYGYFFKYSSNQSIAILIAWSRCSR